MLKEMAKNIGVGLLALTVIIVIIGGMIYVFNSAEYVAIQFISPAIRYGFNITIWIVILIVALICFGAHLREQSKR